MSEIIGLIVFRTGKLKTVSLRVETKIRYRLERIWNILNPLAEKFPERKVNAGKRSRLMIGRSVIFN